MILKISTPSGACPVELKSSEPAAILEWAAKVRAHGEKTDRHYMIESLVFWSRSFDCVDPRDVFEVLVAEYPQERPLSSREWRSLLAGKLASKEERKAAKEEAKEEKKVAKEEKAAKAPVERDAMGNRVGSQANLINVAFLAGHRTAAALCKATGFNSGRMAGHLKFLLAHGFATKNGDEYIPSDSSAAPAVKAEKAAETTKATDKKTKARYTVFGLNACAVCRTLGAKGWEFDALTLAVETLGCRGMSHATMRMHYVAGKKGSTRWGDPAKLTKKQLAQLTEAAK